MRSDEPFDPQTRLLTSDGSQWLVRRPDPGIRSLVVVLLLLLAAALAQAGTEPAACPSAAAPPGP